MAGLIYVTQEWYEKTKDKRSQFLEELTSGKIGNGRYDDEKMLKRICAESRLQISPKRPLIRRHHGIHLGIIRNYCMYGKSRLRSEMQLRVSPAQARQWNKISAMDEYQDIKKRIDDKKIHLEYDFMDDFCRSHGKQRG
jgi:hypothetical protein